MIQTVDEIKESELRHGKMLIGYYGTSVATMIIDSYHVVRKIMNLDKGVSLDMLFDANEKLHNAIMADVKDLKPTYLKEKDSTLTWNKIEKYFGGDAIIRHCNYDINEIMESIKLYVNGNLNRYKDRYEKRIQTLKDCAIQK